MKLARLENITERRRKQKQNHNRIIEQQVRENAAPQRISYSIHTDRSRMLRKDPDSGAIISGRLPL